MMAKSRWTLVSGGLLLLALTGAAALTHRDAFFPSDELRARLPWSRPAFSFWIHYPNYLRHDEALHQLMKAGGTYQIEAWHQVLAEKGSPEEWMDSAVAAPELREAALAALDPDRPRESQLAVAYLEKFAPRWENEIVERAATQSGRARLLTLSCLSHSYGLESGELFYIDEHKNPRAQALFHEACQQQGLLITRHDPTHVTPEEWEKRLHSADPDVAQRAAVELWFTPPSYTDKSAADGAPLERKRLFPHIQRLLNRPLDALCRMELGPLELLGLTQAVPGSRLARGCRDFAKIRGGQYFGDFFHWSGPDASFPERKVGSSAQWRAWLATYPDHPGADDAGYWMGRALEREGQRYEALAFFLKGGARVGGDGDMAWRWHDHILWLLDVGVTADDLQKFLQENPDSPQRANVQYALALRMARTHDYRRALELTEGLKLTAAAPDPYPEYPSDWGLEHPDTEYRSLFRKAPTLDEDLQFQRSLWRRCEAFQGDLYSLAHFWSENGGWRIGYLCHLKGQRVFLWCYSWDAYARDSRSGFRPDADVILQEGRKGNQNEVIMALMDQILAAPGSPELLEKARYTRFAALQSQSTSDAENESKFLGRDFYAEARTEARLLLRDFPDTSMADDVFLSLSEMQERPDIHDFLRIHFPEGDRF